MTREALNGTTLTLWLLLEGLIVFLVLNAAHFSPWELVIPSTDPFSWIMPGLLVGPPIALIAASFMPSRTAKPLVGTVAAVLAVLLLAILVAMFWPVFSSS